LNLPHRPAQRVGCQQNDPFNKRLCNKDAMERVLMDRRKRRDRQDMLAGDGRFVVTIGDSGLREGRQSGIATVPPVECVGIEQEPQRPHSAASSSETARAGEFATEGRFKSPPEAD
jgi:hypothetical protein